MSVHPRRAMGCPHSRIQARSWWRAPSTQKTRLAIGHAQGGSNFGTRIDCFAAGEGVFTLDAGGGNGPDFSGTSLASAIIAGADLCFQGVALAHLGQPFAPAQLREALSDVDCGTPSIDASNDKIALKPDLMKIAKKYIAGG